YYTKFKFIQFGLVDEGRPILYPRLLVSITGVMATWWMGLIIGFILGLFSLMLKSGREMMAVLPKAILLTLIIAFFTGVVGYFYGRIVLATAEVEWNLPYGLENRTDFIAVGSMHNFSYIGGLIGLIVGILYIIKQKVNK
ncbi:MAG: hypothetical protein AB8F74_21700, partial [Saprospiraceae bacterium]